MQSGSTKRVRRHRPALIVLVIVGAAACMLLAWWQWDRYQSASGTAQNLGYALQWPAFGVAFIYAYRRFVVLESDPEEVAKLAADAKGASEIPAGILPERPTTPSASSLTSSTSTDDDSVLAEYNSYLAELSGRATAESPSPSSEDQRA